MGLLTKLQQQGSSYSEYDGTNPPTNPLATNLSQLHAGAGGTAGYSLNGSAQTQVNASYNAYLDGVSNALPNPSQLDLDGLTPPKYLDNPPG